MRTISMTEKLWRGSPERVSRLHDEKGYFGFGSIEDMGDCFVSLASTGARMAFGYRPEVPWITFKAMRFLRERLPANGVFFEWSSGMSTLWFEKHCREITSVEDNREWYEQISKRVTKAHLSYRNGADYIHSIAEFPRAGFDLISIDGSHRLACYELAHAYLKPGGILLIDNTDKDQESRGEMWRVNELIDQRSDYEVHRFPGWTHGVWAPTETTVCVHRGVA